jgi:hypothetical protein
VDYVGAGVVEGGRCSVVGGGWWVVVFVDGIGMKR